MADYPTNLWIRDPVVDGRPYPGGALNRAIALLVQARDEVTAIETELGTNPAGTSGDKAADVAARIAKRGSKSGLMRGRIISALASNASPGTPNDADGWWNDSDSDRCQFGFAGPFTSSPQTISYGRAYTIAPNFVLAFYVAGVGQDRVGQLQPVIDKVFTTTFKVRAREITAAGGWVDAVSQWAVCWLACGGI